MTKNKFRYIDTDYMKKSKIQYTSNSICNQKYRWYSLFFWVFLDQFRYFFSTYFFLIAVTQIKEKFRITSPISSIDPWALVLIICLFKEGYDDYLRFQRDKALNNQTYILYKNGEFKRIKSSDIRVGDVILLQKNERVPADMVLLKTADYSGQLFIKTDQLDGETDWKVRSTLPSIHECSMELVENVKVIAESPHKDIYTFNGSITTESFGEEFFNSIEFEDVKQKGFFDRFKKIKKEDEEPLEDVEPEVYEWVYRRNVGDKKETGIGAIVNDEDIPGHEIKDLEENNSTENNELNKSPKSKEQSVTKNEPIEDSKEPLKTVALEADIETITETKLGVHGLSLENMLWMNTSIATSSALGFVDTLVMTLVP